MRYARRTIQLRRRGPPDDVFGEVMYSDRHLERIHKTGRGTFIIKLYYEKPSVYYQTLLLLNSENFTKQANYPRYTGLKITTLRRGYEITG